LKSKIELLARTMEREFRDLHHSINYRFERVNERLETIEAKIEAFSRRVDNEVEARHVLGERVSKLEKAA
jgi:septation ring formation regulator EzrA